MRINLPYLPEGYYGANVMSELLDRFKIVFIALFFALVAGAVLLYHVFTGPNDFAGGGEKTIFVSRGQTFASIVDTLEGRGIIRSRASFVFVAKMFGGSSRMQIYIPERHLQCRHFPYVA
jgi:cell division protein YceG involved in septum cleavage